MLVDFQVNVVYHTTSKLNHETGLVSMDLNVCINLAVTEIYDIVEDRFPEMYQKCRFWNVYIKDQNKWGMNFAKDNWTLLMSAEHQTLKQRLDQLKIRERFVRILVVGLPIQNLVYTDKVVHLSSLVLCRIPKCKPHLFTPPPLNYGLEVALNLSKVTEPALLDDCREIFLRLADQFLTARCASTMGLVRFDHPMRVDSPAVQTELERLCNLLYTTISLFGTGIESICLEFGKLSQWETLLGSGCSWAEFAEKARGQAVTNSTLQKKSVEQWLSYIEGPKKKKKKQKPRSVKQKSSAPEPESEPEPDRELEETLQKIQDSWKNKQRAPLDTKIYQAIQKLCVT